MDRAVTTGEAGPAGPESDDSVPNPVLAMHLDGRDEACPRCRYNLRDLRDGRCPECGQRLRLTVTGDTPPSIDLHQVTLWSVMTVIALHGVLVGMCLIYDLGSAIRGRGPFSFVLPGLMLLVQGWMVVTWRRTRLIRRPHPWFEFVVLMFFSLVLLLAAILLATLWMTM